MIHVNLVYSHPHKTLYAHPCKLCMYIFVSVILHILTMHFDFAESAKANSSKLHAMWYFQILFTSLMNTKHSSHLLYVHL